VDASGNITLTESLTAKAFIPSSATIPTNGMYLSAANKVSIAANGTESLRIEQGGISSQGTLTSIASTILASNGVAAVKSRTSFSLTDDTATSFTPDNGCVMLFIYSTGAAGDCGIVSCIVGAGSNTVKLNANSNLNVTTGVLNGTTGSDTALTVSTHTDGKIYIENRRGYTLNLGYFMLAP
jgi:hypothetical protein